MRKRAFDPEVDKINKAVSELRRPDHAAFTTEIKAMVQEAESLRLRYMQSRQRRGFVAMVISLLSVLAGSAGFGWFFLMEGDLLKGLSCIATSVLPYIILSPWAGAPAGTYVRAHKRDFMPRLAKALGGFRYDPQGGVNRKVLGHTGIVPQFNAYVCEDCFVGLYKGIKVILSEARLHKGSRRVFSGLFVLLELPQPLFSGHLIITADKKMADDWATTRWKKLGAVPATTPNPEWNRFLAFTDNPNEAQKIIGEKLLKELSEAADVFNRAPLSAVFFKGKYIFLMIPCDKDMFEASDIRIPIPTSGHAEERRKEVEKLLEVIDVFGIYASANSAKSAPAA